MTNSKFDFSISLIVVGQEPIERISNYLELSPTETVHIGEKRPIIGEANENIWVFGRSYRDCEFVEDKLQAFIKDSTLTAHKCAWLQQHGSCVIRIGIQSEYAQVGFCFDPQDLSLLSALGVPVEFSLFSWGGVENS